MRRRFIETPLTRSDVIATGYEQNSWIFTTNLPLEIWTEVRGSERLTVKALDRLTHSCHLL